jgi:hypothetical protein
MSWFSFFWRRPKKEERKAVDSEFRSQLQEALLSQQTLQQATAEMREARERLIRSTARRLPALKIERSG